MNLIIIIIIIISNNLYIGWHGTGIGVLELKYRIGTLHNAKMSTVLIIGHVPDSLLKCEMLAYKERYKKFGVSCIWKLQGNCALYCYIFSAGNSDISCQGTDTVNAIVR